MARTKRSFGTIRRLPSKMYQASYIGPYMAWHHAPGTFTARADAEAWIALERRLIEWYEWIPPAQRRAKQLHDDTQTLRTYADTWLPKRTAVRGLKPEDDLRHGCPGSQPCRERMWKPVRHIGEPAMLDELALLVAAMPERLRIMLELAAWCALRSGEGPSCAEVTSTGGFRLMLPLATLSVFFGPGSLDCRSLEHPDERPGRQRSTKLTTSPLPSRLRRWFAPPLRAKAGRCSGSRRSSRRRAGPSCRAAGPWPRGLRPR